MQQKSTQPSFVRSRMKLAFAYLLLILLISQEGDDAYYTDSELLPSWAAVDGYLGTYSGRTQHIMDSLDI
jgi:hypothetical protein